MTEATLLEKVEDLIEQATTTRSHFYTAKVLSEVKHFIINVTNEDRNNRLVEIANEYVASMERSKKSAETVIHILDTTRPRDYHPKRAEIQVQLQCIQGQLCSVKARMQEAGIDV